MSDIALALANRHSDPVSTVTLTMNAAGNVQIQVDVDDTDVKAAEKVAVQVFDRLCRKYPRKEPK